MEGRKSTIVILDNGHGKETAGKRSPVWGDGTQLFEYEFNRDIVSRIHEALPYFTRVIVPEMTDVSLKTRMQRCNNIANSLGVHNCMLISVHANAGGGTGWECFTSPGQTESDKFATMLYEEAQKSISRFKLRKDYTDKDDDKEERFYVLTQSVCPAVLTENLFMDTFTDCKFIMSEEGRQAIADLHINFIKRING
jgi:N-acetylmuramoyl-L-alanine amidase